MIDTRVSLSSISSAVAINAQETALYEVYFVAFRNWGNSTDADNYVKIPTTSWNFLSTRSSGFEYFVGNLLIGLGIPVALKDDSTLGKALS